MCRASHAAVSCATRACGFQRNALAARAVGSTPATVRAASTSGFDSEGARLATADRRTFRRLEKAFYEKGRFEKIIDLYNDVLERTPGDVRT